MKRLRHAKPQICYQNETIKHKLTGLQNLGCTGYMNCVLFPLFSVEKFRFGIINSGIELECKLSHQELKYSLLYQLARMFSYLSLSKKSSFDTTDFFNAYQNLVHQYDEPKNANQPDDAYFFLAQLMSMLENELKETTYVNLLKLCFNATLCHEMTCINCNNKSKEDQPFSAIFCPVTYSNLCDSLEEVVQPEILQRVTCYHCQSYQSFSKRRILISLPNTIFFKINNVGVNSQRKLIKLNARFEFPEEICLKKYTEPRIPRDYNYFDYELVAVIVHNGTADYGEFYSLIKNKSTIRGILLLNGFIRTNGFISSISTDHDIMKLLSSFYHYYEWMYVFDDKIRAFDYSKLERAAFGGKCNGNSNAYMLMYERKEFVENYLGTFRDVNEVEQCVKKSHILWKNIKSDHIVSCLNLCCKITNETHRLYLCKGCKKARYCCTKCQKYDWKLHRPKCF
eukprot:112995_1